jgi:hypothetical protein
MDCTVQILVTVRKKTNICSIQDGKHFKDRKGMVRLYANVSETVARTEDVI